MEPQHRAQKHLQRMDIVMKAAEIKYGVMFTESNLINLELRNKFARQWEKLNSAIMECRYHDVCTLADGVVRGVWAIEKAMEASQAAPCGLTPIGIGTLPEAAPVQKQGVKTLPAEFWRSGDEIGF